MNFGRRSVVVSGLAMAIAAVTGQALAQPFPNKPVRLIVPYQAASGGDVMARFYADGLRKELAQSFVVENRPGGAGNIATSMAAKAPPDGYTLFLGTAGTHAMNPSLYANPGYDAEKDFVPVGLLSKVAVAVAVSPRVGVRTLGELIAKSKQERVFMALPHATAVVINDVLVRRGGLATVGVPYKGTPAAINDVIGNHVHATIDSAAALQPFVQAGTLIGLGVTSLNQTNLLPGVKTFSEQGFPGFEMTGWYMIFAPKGTPMDVVVRLNSALKKINEDPATRRHLFQSGFDLAPVGDVAQLPEFVRSEREMWGRIIKSANIKVD